MWIKKLCKTSFCSPPNLFSELATILKLLNYISENTFVYMSNKYPFWTHQSDCLSGTKLLQVGVLLSSNRCAILTYKNTLDLINIKNNTNCQLKADPEFALLPKGPEQTDVVNWPVSSGWGGGWGGLIGKLLKEAWGC